MRQSPTIEPPTFANTIEAMERAGERLGRVQTIFAVFSENLATPEIQALDKEWSPKLSAASDEITLDHKLFARIAALYDARDTLNLDAGQSRLLTKTHESFVRNGAKLDPAQKAELTALNQQLASAFTEFSARFADEETHIAANTGQLKGVPAIPRCRCAGKERNSRGVAASSIRARRSIRS